jgi:hypothetical protein
MVDQDLDKKLQANIDQYVRSQIEYGRKLTEPTIKILLASSVEESIKLEQEIIEIERHLLNFPPYTGETEQEYRNLTDALLVRSGQAAVDKVVADMNERLKEHTLRCQWADVCLRAQIALPKATISELLATENELLKVSRELHDYGGYNDPPMLNEMLKVMERIQSDIDTQIYTVGGRKENEKQVITLNEAGWSRCFDGKWSHPRYDDECMAQYLAISSEQDFQEIVNKSLEKPVHEKEMMLSNTGWKTHTNSSTLPSIKTYSHYNHGYVDYDLDSATRLMVRDVVSISFSMLKGFQTTEPIRSGGQAGIKLEPVLTDKEMVDVLLKNGWVRGIDSWGEYLRHPKKGAALFTLPQAWEDYTNGLLTQYQQSLRSKSIDEKHEKADQTEETMDVEAATTVFMQCLTKHHEIIFDRCGDQIDIDNARNDINSAMAQLERYIKTRNDMGKPWVFGDTSIQVLTSCLHMLVEIERADILMDKMISATDSDKYSIDFLIDMVEDTTDNSENDKLLLKELGILKQVSDGLKSKAETEFKQTDPVKIGRIAAARYSVKESETIESLTELRDALQDLKTDAEIDRLNAKIDSMKAPVKEETSTLGATIAAGLGVLGASILTSALTQKKLGDVRVGTNDMQTEIAETVAEAAKEAVSNA